MLVTMNAEIFAVKEAMTQDVLNLQQYMWRSTCYPINVLDK